VCGQIEDEKIHEAAAAKQEAALEAELSGFVDGLKAQRLTGDAARFAAASRYTLTQLVRLLSPEEREACRSYRKDEILTSRVRELLGCSLTELNKWTRDGRLPTLRTKTISDSSRRRSLPGRFFVPRLNEAVRPDGGLAQTGRPSKKPTDGGGYELVRT